MVLMRRSRAPVLLHETVCVSGRVRKCRPWWYDEVFAAVQPKKLGVQLQRLPSRVGDLSAASILLPFHCLPLCDGTVEVVDLARDVDTMRARIVAELDSLRDADNAGNARDGTLVERDQRQEMFTALRVPEKRAAVVACRSKQPAIRSEIHRLDR